MDRTDRILIILVTLVCLIVSIGALISGGWVSFLIVWTVYAALALLVTILVLLFKLAVWIQKELFDDY